MTREEAGFRGAVAFFSPGWPRDSFPNGIITYVDAMREGLRALGTRAIVLTRAMRPECAEPDVIDVLPDGPRSFAARVRGRLIGAREARWRDLTTNIVRELQRLRREQDVRVFEMEETFGLAGRVARESPVPVVVQLHGPAFLSGAVDGVGEDPGLRRRDRAERDGLLAAAAVCAPTADLLERSRSHYALPLPDAEAIPLPVRAPALEQCWSSSTCDPETLAFVGRFDRVKGGDLVIDAFARVLERFPRARLVFVGPDRGLVDAQGRRHELEPFLAARLGDRRGSVEWLGQQPQRVAQQARLGALVTLVASRYENFAYSALEALAAGCPLVVSGVGGLPTMVQHRRNGLVCRPEDPDDLAAQVCDLLADPALAKRLGAQARRDALDRYDPVVIARRRLAFYGRAVARARGAA